MPEGQEQRMENASFAWTATHETADYQTYPPYVNLTGSRLAVRGNEKSSGYPGDYISVDLPPDALADLAAALTRPTADLGEEQGWKPVGVEVFAGTTFETRAERAARDLGEDGELIERVIAGSLTFRNGKPMQDGETAVIKSEDLRALCDRLILYREALGDAFGTLHYIYETTDDEHEKRAAAEARDKIDALLSRSGDDCRSEPHTRAGSADGHTTASEPENPS